MQVKADSKDKLGNGLRLNYMWNVCEAVDVEIMLKAERKEDCKG